MPAMRVREVSAEADLAEVKRLFLAYAQTLGVSLCFQNFDQELVNLPGAYAPPGGCLWLAEFDGIAGGCAALRPLGDQICEMKRLFLEPAFRGTGAGRVLALTVMEKAKSLGYAAIRLDTLPSMARAIELYQSFGFQRIDPYYENPVPGALFLECKL